MHCRFCFRQNYEYSYSPSPFKKELELIAQDDSLCELILSGGDPLSLDNAQLSAIFEELENIPHIRLVRFHTRFPIGIPERIDDDFLKILKKSSKQIFFVLHVNHIKELDDDIISKLSSIQEQKIPVLSQTVLLKGVNDNFNALKELCLGLVFYGIIPYYLHYLDPVTGSQHFYKKEKEAQALVDQLRENLPGYAVPRLVQELPNQKSKLPII